MDTQILNQIAHIQTKGANLSYSSNLEIKYLCSSLTLCVKSTYLTVVVCYLIIALLVKVQGFELMCNIVQP